MTSPATQQNPQATNTSATPGFSYASAAGAPQKSAQNQSPVVATEAQAPAAADSSASPAQNAKPVSPAPVNGKTAAPPNGAHSRHPSVTMAANGPGSFAGNGGLNPGAKQMPQFGFGSPSVAQSSPQTGDSAPINIPGGGNPRVPSPAHSPSPIPQPSVSGGRPPSGLQQPGLQIGSLGSDGERHMRQGSVPGNQNLPGPGQPGSHFRRESTHSTHSQGPDGPARNFQQGGRGRGGHFNPQNNFNHSQMQQGFPPNNQYRGGPNQGGRGMPPAFQPQGAPRNMAYPNSPQPNHRSPAMGNAMPGTPTMPPNQPMPMNQGQYPHYQPQGMPGGQQQNYGGYPPQGGLDQHGRPMNAYNMPPYMGAPPPTYSPGYNQGFVAPQHYQHHHSHSMSRTPSQPERPGSANQHGPQVAMGSNQPSTPNQAKSDLFGKPSRKSAAISIKKPTGELVDTSTFKAPPASPAPSSQAAKTPPVTSSNPTPSPKPAAASHARTDSKVERTAAEIREEMKAKIARNLSAAKTESSEETKPEAKPETKPETKPEAKTQAQSEPKVEAKTEVAAPAAAEKPAEKAPEPEAEEKKAEPAKKPAEKTQEEKDAEMEAMIAEMEAADKAEEERAKVYQAKKEAEKAAAKEKEEADKKSGAADAKLREQEREMERLEEEKEKKRAEGENGPPVAEILAGKAEAPKVESVTDKLDAMKISDKPAGDGKTTTAEKRGAKPAALNLAPLNTKPVEPPQPSAALQSLKSARFLQVMEQDIYPEGIKSPNPATNAAVATKGKTFKYDANFLMQFRGVFTEQPSVEFNQQIKTLIGDGPQSARSASTPRQGSRGGSGAFQMGAFNAHAPPGGRTLPTGTSSEQRFAMSNNSSTRPQAPAINSFNRPGGAFPMGAGMSRNASQSNMGSNSQRQGSRSTRGSRRNDHGGGAREAQSAKTMPLTAGMDLKPIETTSTGWKPTSIGRGASANAAAGAADYLDPPMVQRKVKAALNKMTPENFERISESVLKIASQSKDETDGRTLRQVIQLTFEKATDEAHWAGMYAKFCKKMLDSMSPDIKDERIKDKYGNVVSGGNLFRKYLLNRCQEDFERGWKTDIGDAPEEGDDAPKKGGEVVMLSDEYYKAAAAKRRGLGLVQLIGELYKLSMLTERIMVACIHKLVDSDGPPDEAEIESLCKLLRTIGQHLDMSEKGRPMMDVYFQRIQKTIDSPNLPSRLQFMLMDVVDLRRSNWATQEKDKGPKTLEEVRAEAEAQAAKKAQEAARSSHRGGGRPPPGRGDARNFSGGYQQAHSNQVGMDDLRRLKNNSNRASSGNVTLGPTSMLGSRSNSGRRLGPGGALGRGDDSGGSSRTGTPAPRDESRANAFSLLANMDSETPASPPSTAASPNLPKAAPAEKKEGE